MERHDEEPGIVARIRLGEPIQHYETIRLRKDGSEVAVSLSVSPIRDREGRVIGASKIARDITEQKQTELALKEAKEAAESANRSKDHFLAVLSHELRTPLNLVLMTASALETDPKLSPELRTDMAMIRRNVELETKLIDDLLDLSRITTGKLALHVRPIDLNEAVRQVGAICEQQIAEKGMRMQLELDPEAGHVRADPARLQQVLWNILKNAAKFTPEGGRITVGTHREHEDTVRIAIRDTGIGIAPEVLPKIFEAFEQGDSRITRQFGGLGLGLAITKALVMLHDGTIRVESEGAGKGSTFIIELPSASSERRTSAEGVEERRTDGALRILIVEDHIDTATMLARLLGASGYHVSVANTAGGGLEIYRRQKFDIVVSDIGLPDATGYDFMRSLRAIRAIKGIAMSGYGMEEDIRKSLEAGFNEHLVKPVNLLSLEQAIRRLAATMRTKETPG
jgi:signal transduction histidine kinase/ActR/RegA family two-component response regulator